MAHGELTARAARELEQRIQDPGFDILFDHGDLNIDPPDRVGNISSWFGPKYSAKSQLALLDIAVVDDQEDRALVLIEIEETSSNPKVAIGDAFGTILGDHITFQGRRPLLVGDWTLLVVLVRNGHPGHHERLRFLEKQITHLLDSCETENSMIGQVVLDLFDDDYVLFHKLSDLVGKHLESYRKAKRV
jgi:hypothetical protein